MKKEPKLFQPLHRPIIIIGEKMGAQRKGEDKYALEGNRTGDFVHEAIGDKTNLILTNIVNYYYEGNFKHSLYVEEGLHDLKRMFLIYYPSKIITLGSIAAYYVNTIGHFIPEDCEIFSMPHPSYINRFKSSLRSHYVKLLSDELNTRVSDNQGLGGEAGNLSEGRSENTISQVS